MLKGMRKKKIVLTCYAPSQHIIDFAPIAPASKHIPAWFKRMSRTVPDPTIEEKLNNDVRRDVRRCPGFLDYWKHGFTIPMWSDIAIEVGAIGTDAYRYQYSDCISRADCHDMAQVDNFLDTTKWQHLKLSVPWQLACDEPVEFLLVKESWGVEELEHLHIPNGVLNFKYQKSVHINTFIKRDDEVKRFEIAYGTPLARIIPLSDRPVELRIVMATSEDITGGLPYYFMAFTGTYFKRKIAQTKLKKCKD